MIPKSKIQNPKSEVPVVGLVGGIASGKTFVARQFASLGCEVVDADAIVHDLLGEEAIREEIRETLGEEALDASGRVDRERLGRTVFADPEKRERLEGIVHPPTIERIREAVEAARRRPEAPAVVLDAPLILEKGLDRLCDRIVYIEAEEGVRQARARERRGWDASELARRERTQLPLKSKRARADYVIENRTTPERTLDQVRTTLSRVLNS